jgi:hypothetical protein
MKIIHKAIYYHHQFITIKLEVIYLCNQAVKANRDKCRFQWKYVTCKNCLKQKPTSLNKDSNIMRNFCLRKNLKSP